MRRSTGEKDASIYFARKEAVWVALSLTCLAFLSVVPLRAVAEDGLAVSKDGSAIAYTGKGEPVLVFVHGWSCNRSVWRKQVPYFA